jgi:hypothetical protein
MVETLEAEAARARERTEQKEQKEPGAFRFCGGTCSGPRLRAFAVRTSDLFHETEVGA